MIKISNVETFGFEGAIRGMRNPYESHGKSDSYNCSMEDSLNGFSIGEVDMGLACRLIKAGPEHRKFLRIQ